MGVLCCLRCRVPNEFVVAIPSVTKTAMRFAKMTFVLALSYVLHLCISISCSGFTMFYA